VNPTGVAWFVAWDRGFGLHGVSYLVVAWLAPVFIAWRIGIRKRRRYGYWWGILGSWVGVLLIALWPPPDDWEW